MVMYALTKSGSSDKRCYAYERVRQSDSKPDRRFKSTYHVGSKRIAEIQSKQSSKSSGGGSI